MSKKTIIIIVIVVVVLAASFAAWYFTRKKKNADTNVDGNDKKSSTKSKNGKGIPMTEEKKVALADAGSMIKKTGLKIPGLKL